jgi:solute carrier family 32 (vesicular inhibitory amino acid transporter)
MRSPVSVRSLIIESSDDEDTHSAAAVATIEKRHVHDEEEQGAGSDSDSSSSSSCATPRRGLCSPSSRYTQQWPQSYRSADSSPIFVL